MNIFKRKFHRMPGSAMINRRNPADTCVVLDGRDITSELKDWKVYKKDWKRGEYIILRFYDGTRIVPVNVITDCVYDMITYTWDEVV